MNSYENLHDGISETFNLEDIKTACHVLNIDYENLAGDTKAAKITSLLIYMSKEDRLNDLVAYLQKERPHVDWSSFELPSAEPYRGLAAFGEEDAAFFFGREDFAERLLTVIARQPLTAVAGPSGSGKSSVVFAGLVPTLRKDPGWVIVDFRPGDTPFHYLAAALIQYLHPEAHVTEQQRIHIPELSRQLQEAGELNLLAKKIEEIVSAHPLAANLLLIIDQFEEVFTQCSDTKERQLFIDSVLAALASPKLTILLTMRADFLNQATAYRPLADALQDSLQLLGPMNRKELTRAIEMPAQLIGISFEPGLVTRILNDLGDEPGLLPMMEFALTLLWEKVEAFQLSHLAYEQIGGIRGALSRYADEVYDTLQEDEQERIRKVLLHLVQPGIGTEDTRRRASRREIGEEDWPLVQLLADKRMVVTGTEGYDDSETAEITHEALIRQWTPLRQEIDLYRNRLQLRSVLDSLATDWENSGEDESYLISGERLRQAWQHLDFFSDFPEIFEYLITSRDAENRKLEDMKELESEIQRGKRQVALRKQSEKISDLLLVEPVQGLLQAIQIADIGPDAEGEQSRGIDSLAGNLHAAVARAREIWWQKAHSSTVRTVAFGVDKIDTINNKRILLASGGQDRALCLWTEKGELIGQPYLGHMDAITDIAFSPTDNIVATASDDGTIRMWILNDMPHSLKITGHNDAVTSLAFSPSGDLIASGSCDNTIRLWTKEGDSFGEAITGHRAFVTTVAFSPDGSYIVSGCGDGTIRLWDLEGNLLSDPLIGHEDQITNVIISPDGQTIASGSCDGTIRLWHSNGEARGEPIKVSESIVTSLSFSPDSLLIASSDADQKIQLWHLDGTAHDHEFVGPTDTVTSIAFNHDGSLLASGSSDQTIRLWDRRGFQIRSPMYHNFEVGRVRPLSDNAVISSAGGAIYIWQSTPQSSQQLVKKWDAHGDVIYGLAIDPQRQLVVSGSGDTSLIVWNFDGQQLSSPFSGHNAEVTDVAFLGDGERIVSSSTDGTVRLWDLDGNPLAEPFEGHTGQVNSLNVYRAGEVFNIASCGNDGYICLWNQKGQLLSKFSANGIPVKAVVFVPGSELKPNIFSGDEDGLIQQWSFDGESLGEPFVGHRDRVTGLTLHPTNDILLSTSADGTIRQWSLQGELLGDPIRGHQGPVWAAIYSPIGNLIFSGGNDKTARVWRGGEPHSWLTEACNRLKYHPIFNLPMTTLAEEAQQKCESLTKTVSKND